MESWDRAAVARKGSCASSAPTVTHQLFSTNKSAVSASLPWATYSQWFLSPVPSLFHGNVSMFLNASAPFGAAFMYSPVLSFSTTIHSSFSQLPFCSSRLSLSLLLPALQIFFSEDIQNIHSPSEKVILSFNLGLFLTSLFFFPDISLFFLGCYV